MTPQRNHLRTLASIDGAAILDTRLGVISTLNPTGAFIWEALERGRNVATIAQQLADETGEALDVIERDLAAFLESLRAQELIPCSVEGVQS